jgi:hypothetical protein
MEPGTLSLLVAIAFLASLLSGTIGFGGGIIMLPVLSQAVGVREAVPILTAIQIVSNTSRAFFSIKQTNWRLVGLFLIGAIPFAIIGGLAFVNLDKGLILHLMGFSLLGYILFAIFKSQKEEVEEKPKLRLILGGAVVGFLSGLIGTAGPIGAVIFMSLNLPPLEYIASDASSSMIMHVVKLGVYQSSISMSQTAWTLAGALSCATILGAWCGRRFTQKLPKHVFRKVALTTLGFAAVTLLVQS